MAATSPDTSRPGPWPRAIVFDLDGTLADTAPDLHLVLSEVLAPEGLQAPPLDAVRTMIGGGVRLLLERALSALGQPVTAARIDALAERFVARLVEKPCRAGGLYEEVAPTLRVLRRRGARLGVCTNKPQRASEVLLQALGILDEFATVLGGDVLARRKPDPLPLATVLDRLGAETREAVMVGDSATDLLTARALGVPCVLVSFGYTTTPVLELGADRVIDRFGELPAAFAALAGTGQVRLEMERG